MPEFIPPHVDTKETIDEYHRYSMLKMAIAGIEGLGLKPLNWNAVVSAIPTTP